MVGKALIDLGVEQREIRVGFEPRPRFNIHSGTPPTELSSLMLAVSLFCQYLRGFGFVFWGGAA